MTETVLTIHLGGLGDVCLSESVFRSLKLHFDRPPEALGYPRYLTLFRGEFGDVHSVEDRRWLLLFADPPPVPAPMWERIVLIGKDRTGETRRRLEEHSRQPVLFIESYPGAESVHAEAYQLRQLAAQGISPVLVVPPERVTPRVVLYPEPVYGKKKWPVEGFLELHRVLGARGVQAEVLEPQELLTGVPEAHRIQELADVKAYLAAGGLFVSNDCGVAHLAGALGLATVTLFHDQDPAVWHPRGRNVSLTCGGSSPGAGELADLILSLRPEP